MKKILLSASALVLSLAVSAQLQGTAGYIMDNSSASSNCFLNGAPSNGGIMSHGTTIVKGPNYLLAKTGPLTLTSEGTIPAGGTASWFGLPAVNGLNCGSLFDAGKSIDLSSETKVIIKAKSSAAGAVLEFFLGGEGQWFPSSSTYNIGDAKGSTIMASYTFMAADVEETITFDYAAIDAALWTAWAGKNKVQAIGFRSGTASAVYSINKVLIGSAATSVSGVAASSFSVYPNPANDVVNVTLASSAAATVELADLAGNVVSSQAVSGTNVVVINTANIAAGVYVVSVKSAAGVSAQKVVVK